MDEILSLLPLLIPLLIAELAVVGYALFHIFTHDTYKMGTRALWVVVTLLFMNSFIGPVLYFVLGKERS
jgi:hypothetical protein